MKKILSLPALALIALTANATDYTDRLSVSLGGKPIGNQETTISVDAQDNGKYTLSLNNFQLAGLGGIGNIVLADVDATEKSGMTTLATDQVIQITEGDDPDVQMWFGPKLGDVPVSLRADINGDKLYAVITIDGFGGVDVVGEIAVPVGYGAVAEIDVEHGVGLHFNYYTPGAVAPDPGSRGIGEVAVYPVARIYLLTERTGDVDDARLAARSCALIVRLAAGKGQHESGCGHECRDGGQKVFYF